MSTTDIGQSGASHSAAQVIHSAGSVMMSDSQESSSDSESSMPPTPPSEDHSDMSEDCSPQSSNFPPPEQSPEVQIHSGFPYVHLNEDYDRWLCWSNDPDDLYLATYFDPNEPNLAKDFNVEGLCPVVKEEDSDTFILRDSEGHYYLWDAWEGHLLRVTDIWTEGFESKEKVVENLIIHLSWVEEEADVIYKERKGELEVSEAL